MNVVWEDSRRAGGGDIYCNYSGSGLASGGEAERLTWRLKVWSLADKLFRPMEFEAPLYERLGVRTFKRHLPTGGDRHANYIGWHPIRDGGVDIQESLTKFDRKTRVAESCHILTLAFFGVICVGFMTAGEYSVAVLFALFNLALNVYPIMVQRYNRSRLLRLLDRKREQGVSATR